MSFLTDFRLTNSEQNLGVYGVHVYQLDRSRLNSVGDKSMVGVEIASHRFRSDDRVNLCSASKTVSAVGMGIAITEGRLSVDDCVLDFFPECKSLAAAGSEKITVRHLLHMSSGHLDEDLSQFHVRDRAELFFEQPMKTVAGGGFYYENNCTYMLGRVIEKVTGETMLSYLKPRLFAPLEIVNPQWLTCAKGHTMCSSGLLFTTRELSKIGALLLQEGRYKGQQILSASYVYDMHTDLVDTSFREEVESSGGYGYQVWNCTLPNTYRADGMYGQYTIVLRDYDAVVTITSHNEVDPKDIVRAVWKDIVPKL